MPVRRPAHYNASMNHRRITRLLTLLAIVLGVVFIAAFTFVSLTRTRAFSPDSMNYVDVARNLAEGRGLTQSTLGYHDIRFLGSQDWPVPFTAQPPLYPMLIAGLYRLGISLQDAALVLPAASLVLLLVLAWMLLRRIWGDAAAWLGVALLALNFPLNFAARIAWSDGPGLVFILLALLPGRGVSPAARAAFAGFACGFAFATRFAAAPLIPAVALGVFLATRGETMKRRLVCFGAFIIPLAACVVPILIRNHMLYGKFFHDHFGSEVSLDVAVYQTFGNLFGSWIGLFDSTLEGLALLALILIGIVIARRRGELKSAALPAGAVPLVAWLALYIFFILYQALTIHLDEIGPRLLLPVSVALVIWFAGFFTKAVRLPLVAALALCCTAFGVRAFQEMQIAGARDAAPTLAQRVAASPRVLWVKENTVHEDIIISDDAVDLPFLLGPRRVVSFSPYPTTEHPDYAKLVTWADARRDAGRIFIVLPRFNASQAVIRNWYGDFITDLRFGHIAAYPRVGRVIETESVLVFEVLREAEAGKK